MLNQHQGLVPDLLPGPVGDAVEELVHPGGAVVDGLLQGGGHDSVYVSQEIAPHDADQTVLVLEEFQEYLYIARFSHHHAGIGDRGVVVHVRLQQPADKL